MSSTADTALDYVDLLDFVFTADMDALSQLVHSLDCVFIFDHGLNHFLLLLIRMLWSFRGVMAFNGMLTQ